MKISGVFSEDFYAATFFIIINNKRYDRPLIKEMNKKVSILLTLLALTICMAKAQEYRSVARGSAAGDSSRWDVHMSVGGTVVNGFGNTQALTWVAPRFSYQASEKLTLHTGFAMANSLLPNDFALQGHGTANYAPYREGTRAGAVWAAAHYKAGENLSLWAAVAKAYGWMQPIWQNTSMPVDITAVAGGFAYKFSGGSTLALHFSFVNDKYGTLLNSPYGHPYYYSMLSPYSWPYNDIWPY